MANQTEWTLEIDGLTCDDCSTGVDDMLRKVPGVIRSFARHEDARVTVIAEASLPGETLTSAVAGMGYKIMGQASRPHRGELDDEFDLAIVGGGSAAFAAAIRAADLGATAVIIESETIGGTCVNVGCVPSKTLMRAAEAFYRAGHPAFAGIHNETRVPNLGAMMHQKDELVAGLRQTKYLDVLAAYPSISLLHGHARLLPDGTVGVAGRVIRARKILLATGASPWAPPIPGIGAVSYLTSTQALSLQEIPRTVIVIGGSAVGLEIAQLFSRLGTRVTVLEATPRLAPAEDADVGKALATYLRGEGLTIRTGTSVRRVSGATGAFRVEVDVDGASETLEAEQLLVATGRRPNTRGLGLEDLGIQIGAKGGVVVDEHLETARRGVYAAGDLLGDPMLVYVAAHAGALAAENALRGNTRRYDLRVVPRVTFTDPAVASVGLTEADARDRTIDVAVSKLPLSHVPRAIAARDTRGFIKLIADLKTNLLIGAHILAPEAGEMILEAAMAIQFGIRVDELAAMLHPYLTHAEGFKLACQTFEKDVSRLSCCAA